MKLKALRESRGWTAVELARRARISRMHLFRLESGRSDATVGMARRIARALGVPLGKLLE